MVAKIILSNCYNFPSSSILLFKYCIIIFWEPKLFLLNLDPFVSLLFCLCNFNFFNLIEKTFLVRKCYILILIPGKNYLFPSSSFNLDAFCSCLFVNLKVRVLKKSFKLNLESTKVQELLQFYTYTAVEFNYYTNFSW